MTTHSIHERTLNRWPDILPKVVGIDPRHLTGRHGPCPMCGGKDRFRFDNKNGRGTYYCSGCGPGNGIDLVMRLAKVSFVDAVKLVEPHVDTAHITTQNPRKPTDGSIIARQASPITPDDPAGLYLANRGLRLERYPRSLGYLRAASYRHEDDRRESMPGMLALFVAPDGKTWAPHVTYLTAAGAKADVPSVRKILAPMPEGGAVRLAPAAATLGIAEGIETALSAALLFDIPTWATLNAGELEKWRWPPETRHVIIFADHDANYRGQAAAYRLAHRLVMKGLQAEIRLPDHPGQDWNDVLIGGRA